MTAAASMPGSLNSQDPGGARPRTVLICDDHAEIREVISQMLTNNPRFAVVGDACDGDSCLDRVLATQPDLLILDVNMPGGGPQMARRAKDIQPLMHIVVFSGRQEGAIECAMLEAGADQYVIKTGRLRPLMQAMEKAYLRFEETEPIS